MHKKWMTSLAVAALLALSAAGSADDSEDYENALALAEQGDAFGQYYLGLMYAKGEGVIQDNVYAHMWFNIAASSGDSKGASGNRDITAEIMTTAQIAEAQQLARECVRKEYKGC